MSTRLVVLVFLVLCFPGSLVSQTEHVGPGSTRPQIVSVRLIGPDGNLNGVAFGAGIVIGHDGQSMLVLTARHVITKPYVRLVIGVGAGETLVEGRVILVSHPATDLAVIRIRYEPWHSKGKWRNEAPRLLTARYSPYRGAQAFALGCPLSACWAPPVEARIARLTDGQILVRIATETTGLSGGALVDDRGLIIGVVAGQNDYGLLSVVPWQQAVEWLNRVGIAVNVRTRTVEQAGEIYTEVTAFELPLLLPGEGESQQSLEFGAKLHRSYEVLAGYQNLVATVGELRPTDSPPDQLTAHFLAIGVRYTRPMVVLIRGQPPATLFIGVSGLTGGEHEVVRLEAVPDSFDLRTGEQAYHRAASSIGGGGWRVSVGTRVYLRHGVFLRTSVTRFSLDLPPGFEDYERQTRAEVGVGFLNQLSHSTRRREP